MKRQSHAEFLLQAAAMGSRSQQQHIVMLPFMAQGHIIPFLALAKHIDERYRGSYAITIVNTPLNIRNLHSSIPPDSNIRLRELPFSSSDHGLPPDSENTDCLTPLHMVRLFEASETLQPQFDRLISDMAREGGGTPPSCIIADVFFGWSVDVARKHGVFHAIFTTCGAYGTAAYVSLWRHLPHARTDSDEFFVPGFPETFRLHRSQLSRYLAAADGTDPWSKFFHRQLSVTLRSNGMLCNTAEEVEPTGVRLLAKNTGLPRVWTIGPLHLKMENLYRGRAGKKPGIDLETCIGWLDSHPPDSVLYVSFGSMNTISDSQMMHLAMGLEASGHSFIWVIRPPIGFDINGEFSEKWLPDGFEKRVTEKRQGLLVRKWAPQLQILSHSSIGGFLSHCGWNSVLESLSRGIPIVGWPLAAEQFYNSLMLGEMGVGIELTRGTDSEVCSGEVERLIKLVMEFEEGEEMKKRAAAMAETMKAAMSEDGNDKGSSLKALDDFLHTAFTKKIHI